MMYPQSYFQLKEVVMSVVNFQLASASPSVDSGLEVERRAGVPQKRWLMGML